VNEQAPAVRSSEPHSPVHGSTGTVVESLQEASRRLRHASVRCLAPHGITPAQARALRTILRAGPNGLRMGELADLMGIVPRSATGLVDGLESAGVVERMPDPESRRSVVVIVTQRGSDLQSRIAEARLEAAEELLAPLDDAERRALADLLRRLVGDQQE